MGRNSSIVVLCQGDQTSTHRLEEVGFDRAVTETGYSRAQCKNIEQAVTRLDRGNSFNVRYSSSISCTVHKHNHRKRTVPDKTMSILLILEEKPLNFAQEPAAELPSVGAETPPTGW